MFHWNSEFTHIKESLARVEENLAEHIRRTHNLEGRTESIEKHVYQVQAIGKFLGKALAATALIATIVGVGLAYFKG